MSINPSRVLGALLALCTVSACAATASHAHSLVSTTRGPDQPSSTAAPAPSPTPKPKPKSLEWYVAQVPEFAPAPPARLTTPLPTDAPPFWLRVPTDQKVAFITIDDGGLARPADVPAFIREAHIPVTLFLNSPAAEEHTDYFTAIEAAGGVVENHTIHHESLRGRSYEFQRREICGSADKLEHLFGERPTLFRPPFGDHDATTIRAARDCGAKALFYWTETVNEGYVRYQTPDKVVRPGDVLLMHFRPALMADLLGALKAIHKAGLTPALLEDYVR
ncbi:polysaccharide deacetylase family protein [Asanoa sp. WMMD1127]|uniref:polysaccharide deacetylase family protein n=1 Tax=Asanoa sp. WMMD1127 TaxID=3016107 RepID=UPI002417C2B3|nr:polysaccharide deacetylase family protein [Asanoa sp. WMMD1127]MDG4824289.1 polysaccharide deacetylase family protein [Asanoa sp. WMMD1127]